MNSLSATLPVAERHNAAHQWQDHWFTAGKFTSHAHHVQNLQLLALQRDLHTDELAKSLIC